MCVVYTGESETTAVRCWKKKNEWQKSLFNNWHASIEHTTIHGLKALLGSRLGICVTTRRAASHRARGTRCARCHAAFRGTSGRLGLYPVA